MPECTHSIRFHTLCANCGEDVGTDPAALCGLLSTDKVLIDKTLAETKSHTLISQLKEENKIPLIIDLDQTLISTSIQSDHGPDFFNFTLDDKTRYFVKIRPGTKEFLKLICKNFYPFIYSMGSRAYVEAILGEIDPDNFIFEKRIVTRDENLGDLSKSLRRVVPFIEKNAVILDDRADVWNFSNNLVMIRPYFPNCNTLDDNELMGVVLPLLNELSSSVLKGKKSTSEFLTERREIIFRHTDFFVTEFTDAYINSDYISRLIKMLGGNIINRIGDLTETTHVIVSRPDPLAESHTTINYGWVIDSFCNIKRLGWGGYLEISALNQYIRDLEDEFL